MINTQVWHNSFMEIGHESISTAAETLYINDNRDIHYIVLSCLTSWLYVIISSQ